MCPSHSFLSFYSITRLGRVTKSQLHKPWRKKLAAERLEARQLLATFTVNFSDLNLAPDSHWYGPDPTGTENGGFIEGQFRSGNIDFPNKYSTTGSAEPHFWLDFAYSNESDTVTPGFENQFSSFAGGGNKDANFGVAFGYKEAAGFDPNDIKQLRELPNFTLPPGGSIQSLEVTNISYTALALRDGDPYGFGKTFGGDTGDDPDWFKVTAYGTDASGEAIAGVAPEFYLADYRDPDNLNDYVVDTWQTFDLSALAGAQTIYFNVTSSDVGTFGMNSPGYFAIDDVVYTTPDNTAPTLDAAPDAQLGAIDEDEANAAGVRIADLLGGAVSDPDAGALAGMAVVGTSIGGGAWQYSLNDGATWLNLGTPSETAARLLPSDNLTRIRLVPDSNFSGDLTISYRAWDQTEGAGGDVLGTIGRTGGSGTFSTATETAVETVKSLNDAPFLDKTLTPSLGSILEDAKNPTGTLIKYLARNAITDVDDGARPGLAIVSAYGKNGDWQFSLDSITWQSMTGASESAARLLSVDETTRVRFVPKANYFGDAWISYRAWDQTEGTVGETLSTQARQGLTETFSTDKEAVKITVAPINDAPVVSLSGTVGYVSKHPAIVLAPFARVTDVDNPDFAGGQLKVRIASGKSNFNLLAIDASFTVDETLKVRQGTTHIGDLNLNGGKGTTALIVTFNSSATKKIVQDLVRAISFRTSGGSTGTRIVKFSVSDGAGGLSAEASKTVNVT